MRRWLDPETGNKKSPYPLQDKGFGKTDSG
jgi:hypothetical protein